MENNSTILFKLLSSTKSKRGVEETIKGEPYYLWLDVLNKRCNEFDKHKPRIFEEVNKTNYIEYNKADQNNKLFMAFLIKCYYENKNSLLANSNIQLLRDIMTGLSKESDTDTGYSHVDLHSFFLRQYELFLTEETKNFVFKHNELTETFNDCLTEFDRVVLSNKENDTLLFMFINTSYNTWRKMLVQFLVFPDTTPIEQVIENYTNAIKMFYINTIPSKERSMYVTQSTETPIYKRITDPYAQNIYVMGTRDHKSKVTVYYNDDNNNTIYFSNYPEIFMYHILPKPVKQIVNDGSNVSSTNEPDRLGAAINKVKSCVNGVCSYVSANPGKAALKAAATIGTAAYFYSQYAGTKSRKRRKSTKQTRTKKRLPKPKRRRRRKSRL